MRGISQLKTVELSNYITPGFSQKVKFLKPRISMFGSWHVSGVLSRTDVAEVALADNGSTGEPAIVTYLLPSVLPGTSEYNLFMEAGRKLHHLKKLQFHEELRVTDFGKKLSGLRYVPKGNSGYFVCSECEVPISDWPPIEHASVLCGNCANEIGYFNCDIWLPAISTGFENHITLKHAFQTLRQQQLRIPSGIFCHILYRTASEMMSICKKRIPVVVSSETMMVTARGKVRILPAPTARAARGKAASSDIPAVVADYFRNFLPFVPDPSDKLMGFFSLANRDAIRSLKEEARSVSSEEIVNWLRYLHPSLFASGLSRQDAYYAVQGMIVTNKETAGLSPSPPKIVPEESLGSPAPSTPNVIQQHGWNRSFISDLASRLHSFRVVAVAVFVILGTAWLFGFSGIASQSPSLSTAAASKTRAVGSILKSTPATIVRNSVPAALKERLDNSPATVRVLVSEQGVTTEVHWIYASHEQRMVYQSALSQLKFEPASNSGKPVTGWTTLQLPMR